MAKNRMYSGGHFTTVTPRHSASPSVVDNLNTHTPASLYEAFAPDKAKALRDRFEFVHTPKHGSWRNVAEIEINVMVRQCLNRRIADIETVRSEVSTWLSSRDLIKATINGQFNTKTARTKLKRLYPALGRLT